MPEKNPTARLRVLIVEDHAATRHNLQLFFERRSHVVEVARTCQEATTKLETGEFDLLVSDIGLSDGSGWDLLANRASPKPLYAVAISGYASKADRARSKEAGYHLHLAKPFTFAQLDQALALATEMHKEIAKSNC